MKYLHIVFLMILAAMAFIACPNTPPDPPTPGNCTTCTTPTGLQATDIQDTTIKVAWNLVPTADFYRLKLLDSNGVVLQKLNVNKDTSQFRFQGLVNENLYVIRLISYCHVGTDTCFSDSASIQARTTAGGGGHVVIIEDNIDAFTGNCLPITTFSEGNGLMMTRKGTCTQLAWSPPANARNYLIAYRPVNPITGSNTTDCANVSASNKWFCRMLSGVPAKANSMNYHLICLCPNTTYQVKVLAYPTSYSCLNFSNVIQWSCTGTCN